MIRGIHHIGMHTKNFDAMRSFYKDALGFEEVGKEMSWTPNARADSLMGIKNGSGRLITLKGPNCSIELFEYYSPPPRDAGPAAPNDLGYTHFSVEVTDIEAEYERMKGLGMTFTAEAPINMGFAKSIYGRDPDGNVIELQQIMDNGPLAFENFSIAASPSKNA
jgi:catechol 2,3-dioxygenase-like lactoylglutathione lyase family enzyme